MTKADDKSREPEKSEDSIPTASTPSSVVGPGTQIDHFRVDHELGRGGAGVVYLAHDTRLGRKVAIKMLPPEIVNNPEILHRWKREARLLASLNHPNIAIIHEELEETEGTSYLILEYVEGETLRERIARGRLTIEETMSISLQIAEAISSAHSQGVVHRDLKPANIKITPEGRVKVLDFGISKILGSRKGAALDTIVTQAGRVIGTPAYMSPEQARGNPMDRRTDIWSFGCLLYEMLSGRLPFEGETTTDVLARIIEREPDWNRLPPTTPPNIRVLLWRCLGKDPRRRLQHMGDVVLELDETLNTPPDKPGVAEPVVKVVRQRRWWLAIAFSMAGIIVGLIAAGIFLGNSGSPSLDTVADVPARRTVITLPEDQVLGFFQATIFGIRRPALALSPDGSRLVYVARVGGTTQLFERLMNQYEVWLIPGTEGASSPFFSPDGQSVGFFVGEHLKKVSLRGGNPVMICNARLNSGGSWSDDGMIYFCGADGLFRVPATGGDAVDLGICVLSVDGPRELEPVFMTDYDIFQEALSSDGKYIVYASNKEGDFHIYVCPYPEFNWVKRISRDFGEEPIWSNNSDELFYRSRDKWMVVPISMEPEFKAGTPTVIFEGEYINVPGFSYDVAPDGKRFLVLKPEHDDSQIRELHVVTNWFEELKRLVPSGKEG